MTNSASSFLKEDDSLLSGSQWGFVVKVDASTNEDAFQE